MVKHSLSVIVPVFNMVKYIRDCVDSLLAQTYNPMQIILVNDCSTDNSLQILREYESMYPDRITVIDSKENLRQGGARNLGIIASKSDYIGFVDADDFVSPMMYKTLMEEVNSNDADAVYCGFQDISSESSFKATEFLEEYTVTASYKELDDNSRMEMMTTHEYGSVWGGGVYRRSLIEEKGLFFPEHLAYEDNFWVYALQMELRTVAILPQRLYYYRKQEASTIHKKNAIHHFDRIEISDRLIAHARKVGLFDRYFEVIEYLFIEVFTMNTFSVLIKTFDVPDYNRLTQVKENLKKEFPNWRKNRFYKAKFSHKKKTKMYLLMSLPVRIYVKLVR